MVDLRKHPSALILAPMEGVTDAPMRALMAELGGFTFCVAEFLRVSQHVPPPHIMLRHMPELGTQARTRAGLPVQLQLLGGDPERLAQSACSAVAAQATAIDLNFGCPARTVNRHDGGASLLKHPQRIFDIVHTVRQALPAHIPVSAKLRLGWDDPKDVIVNAEMATRAGAAWITIHGRTRAQGYKPPAYWHPIGELRTQLPIPVVANGDIWDVDDLRRCQDITGCTHFMLGRGAIADPSLPKRAAAAIGSSISPPPASGGGIASDWGAWLSRFAVLSQDRERRPGFLPGRLKQWAKMANQRVPNTWYEKIKRLATTEEILAMVRQETASARPTS